MVNQVIGRLVVVDGCGCGCFVGGLDEDKELELVPSRLVVGDVSCLVGVGVVGFFDELVWGFVVVGIGCGCKVVVDPVVGLFVGELGVWVVVEAGVCLVVVLIVVVDRKWGVVVAELVGVVVAAVVAELVGVVVAAVVVEAVVGLELFVVAGVGCVDFVFPVPFVQIGGNVPFQRKKKLLLCFTEKKEN